MKTPDAWTVDLRRKMVTHTNGFMVFVTECAGGWQARRSNAETWVKPDFDNRAPMVPVLLRAAVTEYEKAHRKQQTGKTG